MLPHFTGLSPRQTIGKHEKRPRFTDSQSRQAQKDAKGETSRFAADPENTRIVAEDGAGDGNIIVFPTR